MHRIRVHRAPRAASGYTGEADREPLVLIGKAKGLGLSLEDIAQLLAVRRSGTAPCTQVLGMVENKIILLDEQIRRMSAFRNDLRRLVEQAVPASCQGQVCGIVEGFEPRHANPVPAGRTSRDLSRLRAIR